MYNGAILGSCNGDWRDTILELRTWLLGGGIKFSITVYDRCRERWFAVFINGRWTGKNYYAPISGDIEDILPIDFGTDVASIIAYEVGDAVSFNTFVPDDMARLEDALSARRLKFNWQSTYSLTPVSGDTQLSAITISGAKRGVNVASVEDLPTRGRLYYTIVTIGTTHYVRWWRGSTLVAEGSRVGNGAVACVAMNGSGLTVNCTLTYTADVAPNAAFLDCRWLGSYQIHFQQQSTNLFLWSEQMDHAPWSTYNANTVVTPDQADAPDGTHTADQVACGAGSLGEVFVYNHVTGQAPGVYTVSVFLKGTPDQQVYVYPFFESYGAPVLVTFDGTWQRISLTGTLTGGGVIAGQIDIIIGTNPLIDMGTGTVLPAVTFYAWGGMLNVGATPGPYVRTTGAPASGLVFPRTPEATMSDNGADAYSFLTPVLASGAYNYNILGVDDDGVVQTTIVSPPDSPLTIQAAPASPTITGCTGSAAAGLTPTWTVGEAGCTFTVYYSLVNQPINYDVGCLPAPITTAMDATSATTPAITGYTPVDNSGDYATVLAAVDACVSALNAGYAGTNLNTNAADGNYSVSHGGGYPAGATIVTVAVTVAPGGKTILPNDVITFVPGTGESYICQAFDAVGLSLSVLPPSPNGIAGAAVVHVSRDFGPYFSAILATQISTLKTAIAAYSAALGKPLAEIGASIDFAVNFLTLTLQSLQGQALQLADWQIAIESEYGGLLTFFSNLAVGHSGRYTFPDGTLPLYSSLGSLSTGNLLSAAQPFVKPAIVRFIVRAMKGGVQEHGDQVFDMELSSGGATVNTRPNVPDLQKIDENGLTVTFNVAVIEDNANAPAVAVVMVVNGANVVSVDLPDAQGGVHAVGMQYTFGAAGWYTIEFFSQSALAAASPLSVPLNFYATNVAGVAVTGLSASVVRS